VLSPWRESRRRRAAWLALIAAVLLAHALFGLRVLASVIGWNSAAQPKRIEISFSRQLQPTAPPVATAPPPSPSPTPAPRAPRAVRASRASSAPASAPEATASSSRRALEDEALALAERLETAQRAAEAASAASAAESRAAEVAAAAASAASAAGTVAANNVDPVAGPERKPLSWPPSTRLTYTLTGQYRGGPLYGKAVVEWRRAGTHYQVQFDVHLSPFFDRKVFSDGQITDRGLSPRHYDESLELPLVAPRRSRIEFTDDEVLLPNGNRLIKFPQTQDQASQFVQFVWLFTTRPELARPGTFVDIPLALPHGVRRWHYRVEGSESVELPFGAIDAIHLVPVRDGPRRQNEYPFEFWTAPTLQYLPVQVLVPLDDKNYAELTLDALPLQAAPVPEDGAASQAMLR
jgi:hypothetical protein